MLLYQKIKGDKMNENNVNTDLYPKMFTWLFIGLLVTFATGYALTTNVDMMVNVLSIGVLPIAIAEIVIAIILGVRLEKMNPITTKILYIGYAILTGLTFSSIFIYFEMSSLISIFIITAVIFGLLAFYGYVTKKDLTKLGTIIFIGLIGIVIGELLNLLIFKNATLDLGITIIGVLIFVGYVAYDVNRIKYMVGYIGEEKAAIFGAFQLYLDFINLFIRLLQLFGKRND